jgi:hypothetical protein
VIGALLVLGDLLLVRELIHQGSGEGTIDPAAVGAVGGVSTLAGTVIGALGTLLVSTRSTPTVDNADAEPAVGG